MQEKIVFTVPGQRNWTKLALKGVGGLLALNLLVFGVVLMSRSGTKPVAVAPVNAEAPATKAAAPAPAAKATTALAAVAPVAAPEIAEPEPARKSSKASNRRSRHGRGKRTLAKGSGGNTRTASAAPASGKSDAIDELLKRAFK